MTNSVPFVLVIDDEEIIREALEALLSAEGYRVITAETAALGRARLLERSYDAVLLDLMLPDGNGLEVLEDIRKHDEDLPVVMITAFGTIESAQEFLSLLSLRQLCWKLGQWLKFRLRSSLRRGDLFG